MGSGFGTQYLSGGVAEEYDPSHAIPGKELPLTLCNKTAAKSLLIDAVKQNYGSRQKRATEKTICNTSLITIKQKRWCSLLATGAVPWLLPKSPQDH